MFAALTSDILSVALIASAFWSSSDRSPVEYSSGNGVPTPKPPLFRRGIWAI